MSHQAKETNESCGPPGLSKMKNGTETDNEGYTNHQQQINTVQQVNNQGSIYKTPLSTPSKTRMGDQSTQGSRRSGDSTDSQSKAIEEETLAHYQYIGYGMQQAYQACQAQHLAGLCHFGLMEQFRRAGLGQISSYVPETNCEAEDEDENIWKSLGKVFADDCRE